MSDVDVVQSDLMKPDKPLQIEFDDATHKYTVNGKVLPSVTTILDAVLPKPALTWWGFRVGLAAAVELSRDGALSWADLIAGHDEHQRIVDGDPTPELARSRGEGSRAKDKTLIEFLAQEANLDPNKVKGRAARRGTGVHEALNTLGLGGTPDIDSMPEVERPFALALNRWWLDQGDLQVELMEQPVASLSHGYAGRFDLLYRHSNGQLVLADLKTGKEVRPDSYYRQLVAYKIAWEEMGGATIDRMEIVMCKPDGQYSLHDATGKVTDEVWFGALAAYRANETFKDLNRKRPKR